MDQKYQKSAQKPASGSPGVLSKTHGSPSDDRKSVDEQIERALAEMELKKKEDFKAGLAEKKAREAK